LRARLPEIQRRVKAVEDRLVPPERRDIFEQFGDAVFQLPGVREPHYQGTPIIELSDHLESLQLSPNKHVGVLGVGLGSSSFAAAAHFDRVTGFEDNAELYAEAEAIRKSFGIDHVEFRREDFMSLSLRPFNVIFFFRSFAIGFFQAIAPKLLDTNPETVIISGKYMEPEIYDPANFTYFKPLDGWRPDPEFPYFPLAKFYTFVRK